MKTDNKSIAQIVNVCWELIQNVEQRCGAQSDLNAKRLVETAYDTLKAAEVIPADSFPRWHKEEKKVDEQADTCYLIECSHHGNGGWCGSEVVRTFPNFVEGLQFYPGNNEFCSHILSPTEDPNDGLYDFDRMDMEWVSIN